MSKDFAASEIKKVSVTIIQMFKNPGFVKGFVMPKHTPKELEMIIKPKKADKSKDKESAVDVKLKTPVKAKAAVAVAVPKDDASKDEDANPVQATDGQDENDMAQEVEEDVQADEATESPAPVAQYQLPAADHVADRELSVDLQVESVTENSNTNDVMESEQDMVIDTTDNAPMQEVSADEPDIVSSDIVASIPNPAPNAEEPVAVVGAAVTPTDAKKEPKKETPLSRFKAQKLADYQLAYPVHESNPERLQGDRLQNHGARSRDPRSQEGTEV
jgi:hypothetical protein